jgi:hypothetical protein
MFGRNMKNLEIAIVEIATCGECHPVAFSQVAFSDEMRLSYQYASQLIIEMLYSAGRLPAEEPGEEELAILTDGSLLIWAPGIPFGVLFAAGDWSPVASA